MNMKGEVIAALYNAEYRLFNETDAYVDDENIHWDLRKAKIHHGTVLVVRDDKGLLWWFGESSPGSNDYAIAIIDTVGGVEFNQLQMTELFKGNR